MEKVLKFFGPPFLLALFLPHLFFVPSFGFTERGSISAYYPLGALILALAIFKNRGGLKSFLKFSRIELYFLSFALLASASVLWGKYNQNQDIISAIKIFIPIASTFFFTKYLFESLKKEDIEDVIFITGYLLIVLQILAHILGFYPLNQENPFSILNTIFLEKHYPRFTGIFRNPNFVPLYFSLFYFFFLSTRKKSFLHSLGLVLCGSLTVLSQSRTGLISFFVGTLVYFIYESKKTKYLLKFLFIFCVLVSLILIPLNYFINQNTKYNPLDQKNFLDTSIYKSERLTSLTLKIRMEIWKNAGEVFLKNPLLGIGYNNFYIYDEAKSGINNYHPHQIFLGILAELGIIGFFLFCLFYFEVFKSRKSYPKFFILFHVYFIVSGLAEYFLFLVPFVISLPIALNLEKISENEGPLIKNYNKPLKILAET